MTSVKYPSVWLRLPQKQFMCTNLYFISFLISNVTSIYLYPIYIFVEHVTMPLISSQRGLYKTIWFMEHSCSLTPWLNFSSYSLPSETSLRPWPIAILLRFHKIYPEIKFIRYLPHEAELHKTTKYWYNLVSKNVYESMYVWTFSDSHIAK